jgi:hypothetical protein
MEKKENIGIFCISNHAFQILFVSSINVYKLFIYLACSVCAEKYRTSVFLYKPRPTGSVCTKKTSVRYFSVQTSHSVNKKLFIVVARYISAIPIGRLLHYTKIQWAQTMCKININSDKNITQWLLFSFPTINVLIDYDVSASGYDNRPSPYELKFWSRQAWTKISSQLERASQN